MPAKSKQQQKFMGIVRAIQKDRDIVRQWQMTEMDFMHGIKKIQQMMDKTTGSRTSSRILDKSFGKKVSPLMDKIGKLINDLSATNK